MALIGLMGILLYGACGSEKKEIPKQIYIGVACYDQRDTFLGELLENFKRECRTLEKRGYDISLTIMDAANSQRTQDDQVQEMIGNGCDILCVNLADRTDPSQIITAAQEHDIPIIFFNREPVEEDLMQWDQLYYVGAEAKQSGQMQGQLAADYIKEHPDVDRNHDGKIQYVILEGEMGHQDAIIRTESVVESLKEQGIELEKLSYQIANWNRAQAQNRMMQLIGQYNNRMIKKGRQQQWQILHFRLPQRMKIIQIRLKIINIYIAHIRRLQKKMCRHFWRKKNKGCDQKKGETDMNNWERMKAGRLYNADSKDLEKYHSFGMET